MKTIYVLLAILLPGVTVMAQPLLRDVTFNNNDSTANASTRCVAVQADGKIVFYGDNTYYNGTGKGGGISINYGGRLNADGTLDLTFKKITVDGRIDDVEIQQFDQKILICGGFTTVNGKPRMGIARLNTDGSVDETFDPGTGIAGPITTELRISAIEIRETADPTKRRIYVGGDFSYFDGHKIGDRGGVACLFLDGKPDVAYQGRVEDGVIYDMVYDKAKDQLYVGGEFYKVDGIDKWRLARLNGDGKLDPTYAVGLNWWNCPGGTVTSLFLNSDGKLLAGGYFKSVDGKTRNGLARFELDGKLDMTFNTGSGFENGTSAYDKWGTEVRSVLVMSDGSVIAGGNFTKFNGLPCGNIVKIDANGNIDPSITFGSGFNDCVFEVRIQKQPSGEEKIVAGGFFGKYMGEHQGAIMRLVAEMTLAGGAVKGKATATRDGVLLKWTTSITDPLATLTIERSVDGSHFTAINSNLLSSFTQRSGEYVFNDGPAVDGVVYYRILVQENGRSQYSNLMRVNVSGAIGATVGAFPNPVGATLSLRSNFTRTVNCSIELYDMGGALLKTWQRSIGGGIQVSQFSMPALGNMPLVLRVKDGAGSVLAVSKLNHIAR